MTGIMAARSTREHCLDQDQGLNRQEGEYIELDYRDLDFILGELDPRGGKHGHSTSTRPVVSEFVKDYSLTSIKDYARDTPAKLYTPEVKEYTDVKEYTEVKEYTPKEISEEPLVKNYSIRDVASSPFIRNFSLEEIFQFNKNDGLREFSQAQSYIAKEITVREITSRPESQQLTLEELSTPSLESREAAPLILPQAAPLTVNVIKDQGDIHDRLRVVPMSVDEIVVRKALGFPSNNQQECSTPLSLPDEWTISQPESIPITYNNNIHLALDVPESVPNLGLNTMGLNLSNDSHIFLNNYRTENLQDDIRRAQEDDLLRRQHDDAHHRQHEDIRIHQEDIHRQHDDIHSQHDIHHRHRDDIHHGHHEDINRGHHDDMQGCYDSTLHRGPTVSSLVSIGTVNSECLNRKLSSVNFDTESTGSHSDTSGTSGGGGRKSRDDKVIYELSIPFTADRIINCSMDDFNNMLVSNGLTEEQINTCRDIRRRGKNKIAAQNCRKRKVDQITNLAEEVDAVREKKTRILDEQEQLTKTLSIWRSKMKRLESYVLQRLGHDPGDWALEVVEENDQVTLVPRGIR